MNMPVWRNGRRTGLKIPSSQGRVGSTPTTGTTSLTLGVYRQAYIFIKVISFHLSLTLGVYRMA